MSISKTELRFAMSNVSTIHFVGVGGVGMSGIAEIFFNLGFKVSGSDLKKSTTTERLQGLGLMIFYVHNAENVKNADVVVISTAINHKNTEIVAAKKLNITIIRRAEMLAELMRFKFGVAITGTHGKTTTTSLVASVLSNGGLDPTYVIGGKLTSLANNAKLGDSRYLVAEADESDASFLHLNPMLSVITNIDQDHMETYDNSKQKLHHVFVEFIHNLPFYGKLIACIDDEGVREILPKINRSVIKYGFSQDADFRAEDVEYFDLRSKFTVKRRNFNDIQIVLNIPGKHNILNALATITVATELKIDDDSIINSLKTFAGVGRRFQQYGNYLINDKKITIVDDYAHHPKELEVTIKTAKQCFKEKRLVVVFQPHRYSRTIGFFDDFVKVLSEVDYLVLLPVYKAGEEEIPGASSKNLATSIRTLNEVDTLLVEDFEETISSLEKIIKNNDVIVFLGAGDIGVLPLEIAENWEKVE